MGYEGGERRVHRVLVTRNSEYHLRGDRCIAVRDRRSGRWDTLHLAVSREIHGTLRFLPNGAVAANRGQPNVGDSVVFKTTGKSVVTSPVLAVERPSLDTVRAYEKSSVRLATG